jgi:hypothetical protein
MIPCLLNSFLQDYVQKSGHDPRINEIDYELKEKRLIIKCSA